MHPSQGRGDPGDFLSIAIVPPVSPPAAGHGGDASARDGTGFHSARGRLDQAGDWLSLSPVSGSEAAQSEGLSNPWQPVARIGAGAAMPSRGGSGNGTQAATESLVRGQITPLRLPLPPNATTRIPIVPGPIGTGGNVPAPLTAPANSAPVHGAASSPAPSPTTIPASRRHDAAL